MVDRFLVSVVDDDESVRESLPELLKAMGYTVQVFASAEDFLAAADLSKTKCLILDVAMAGMSGLELQQELINRRHNIPIVFVTAHEDDRIRKHALEQGAVECLYKPFSEAALLDALNGALQMK